MATKKGCERAGKSAPRKRGEKCGPKLKKKPKPKKKVSFWTTKTISGVRVTFYAKPKRKFPKSKKRKR